MKIAVVADIHMRGKKLEDKEKAWRLCIQKMIDMRVDCLFLAGDVFDNRNIGGKEVSLGTVYRSFIDPLSDFNGGVIAILGNHELATGNQLSALEVLKTSEIEVVDSFGVVKDFDDAVVACLPWLPDGVARAEELNRWLLCIKKAFALVPNKMKIVIGHASVKGAEMNSGICLSGSEFEVTPEQLDSLCADCIALGHIHKRQKYYVGALCQNNFGEEGNPQGFLVIDTVKRTQEFVEINAPEYKTVEVGEDCAVVPFGDQSEEVSGSYVKYRFNEKPDNYDEIIANPRASVEIIPDRKINERKVEGIEPGKAEADLLFAYLRSNDKPEADCARIVGRAKELMGAIH